jgi:low temperature requirement protein LtrA
LFFDLVFVFCVTQVVTLLHGHVDVRSGGSALLAFWLVWWAWTQFTWALNAANTEHPRVQLAMLFATSIAFLLAIGIPGAFTGGALGFAGPYVALRCIGLLLYAWVAWGDVLQRRAVLVFTAWSLAGLAAVLIGAVSTGLWLHAWWGLAIVLDLVAAMIGAQREGWNLHPDHFVERHGLIVIIALGESLIVTASGLVGQTTMLALATGLLAVAVTGALWWSYFRHIRHMLEHALASCDGAVRSSLARDAFSVMHFPMLCGVILLAAGTEQALARPDQTLDVSARVALAGGVLLFAGGTAAAFWRATGRVLVTRLMAIAAGAIVVVVMAGSPAAVLGVLLATLVVVGWAEHLKQSAH